MTDSLDPAPQVIGDVNNFVWRQWFGRLYAFIKNHISSHTFVFVDSSSTPHAAGSEEVILANNLSGAIEIYLPPTSLADHRIYYVKRMYSTGSTVRVYTHTGETIDNIAADTTAGGMFIKATDCPKLLADASNTGWWLI